MVVCIPFIPHSFVFVECSNIDCIDDWFNKTLKLNLSRAKNGWLSYSVQLPETNFSRISYKNYLDQCYTFLLIALYSYV